MFWEIIPAEGFPTRNHGENRCDGGTFRCRYLMDGSVAPHATSAPEFDCFQHPVNMISKAVGQHRRGLT